MRVYTLDPLTAEQVGVLVDRALADAERGLGGRGISLEPDARKFLAESAQGDARTALSTLELAAALAADGERLSRERIEAALQRKAMRYDKAGEEHFNVISALHKSLRDSDVQAGLYWLARMLEAGEDPLYVARRLVRFASEDVGLADPRAPADDRRPAGGPLRRDAGGGAGSRPGGGLSRRRAQIERPLSGLRDGGGRCATDGR
jgi:putative ATPase